ncbi:MAG: NAD(P)H-binding protein [Pseudomonadota bacterium]
MMKNSADVEEKGPVLVVGGTGKTGRRVAARLQDKGVDVRIGSRTGSPPFDWQNEEGWDRCLEGVKAAYITFAPDLAVPGSTDLIGTLCQKAKQAGVQHLVLLSGRGEAEAQACERIVQHTGIDWTIVRASWFFQNFSEGAFLDMVLAGKITLPDAGVLEPFVDANDIADVVAAALTEPGHTQQVYEVTGPRLMSFHDAAMDIASALQRNVTFTAIPHFAFIKEIEESGAPQEMVWLLDYLFTTVLDGRNAHLTDGVYRALGRPPRDFSDYAQRVAASGTWSDAA